MTLQSTLDGMAEKAITDDLQSISGVWLKGFQTEFSDVISTIMTNARSNGASAPAWRDIRDIVNYVYGDVEPAPNNAAAARAINQVARLIYRQRRDYNLLNDLLGFGAENTTLSQKAQRVGEAFDLGGNTPLLADPDFTDRYCQLIEKVLGTQGVTNKQTAQGGLVKDADITDTRSSKLYLKVDLSEWLYIKNVYILHVVVEPPETVHHYFPLGRTTVWLPADAQIQHVRSKTSKTFLRGQIAQRLRIEDIESNLPGFVNTIFDTDSEQAYSSSRGPC